MKKVLVVVAAALGAAYAKRKVEQQRSEKDLFAATSRMGTTSPTGTSTAWAAATDRPS